MLKAADLLENWGLHAEVIDMISIKPIDINMIIKSSLKTRKVFTCEEHNIIGGLGSAVLETLEEKPGIFLKRIGINDCFGESGLPDELFKKYGLSADEIARTVKEHMEVLS